MNKNAVKILERTNIYCYSFWSTITAYAKWLRDDLICVKNTGFYEWISHDTKDDEHVVILSINGD